LDALLLTSGSCKSRQRSCHEEEGGEASTVTSWRSHPWGNAVVFYTDSFQLKIKNGCFGLALYFADD
jgi:hypothetical protein